MIRLLIIALLFTGTSCHLLKKGTKESTHGDDLPIISVDSAMVEEVIAPSLIDDSDSVLFTIQRTACFGQCAQYFAIVYTNGKAFYTGENFVEKLGNWRATFPTENAISILEYADSIGYFDMKDKYDAKVTDLPSTITEIHMRGKSKKIINRIGGPDELKEFQLHLEKFLNGLNWEIMVVEDK